MSAFTVDDILRAFIARSARDKSHVTLAERSLPNGYVRIYGPSAKPRKKRTCHLIVERMNGAVAVTKELRSHLSVHPRPMPAKSIAADPAGFSSGPKYGRFRWIVTEECASADDLVDRLIGAFAAANLRW
jgi:hypothetical protein